MNYLYFIKNYDKPGKARFVNKLSIDYHFILHPAFKIHHDPYKLKEVQDFVPGYVDRNNAFFYCPISIFYVQIYKASQFGEDYKCMSLEIELKIFNKDFSKQRDLSIKIKLNFEGLIRIINLINEYVESNRDIDLIDFSEFEVYKLTLRDKTYILLAVDNLKFEFYDNSRSHVGKDDDFWLEAEVRNLPSDKYLNKLIFENLAKQCEIISRMDYGIIMFFREEKVYSPSFDRTKSKKSDALEKETKDLLKLDMAIEYNSTEQILEAFTKNPRS